MSYEYKGLIPSVFGDGNGGTAQLIEGQQPYETFGNGAVVPAKSGETRGLAVFVDDTVLGFRPLPGNLVSGPSSQVVRNPAYREAVEDLMGATGHSFTQTT